MTKLNIPSYTKFMGVLFVGVMTAAASAAQPYISDVDSWVNASKTAPTARSASLNKTTPPMQGASQKETPMPIKRPTNLPNPAGDINAKKDEASVAINHCVNRFDSTDKNDKLVIDRMESITKKKLAASSLGSPDGTAFSFSPSGNLMLTVTALPRPAIDKLAAAAGFANSDGTVSEMVAGVVRDKLSSGVIQFSGSLCMKKSGAFYINLVGVGEANGKSGRLALLPSARGIKANGTLAGGKINESFIINAAR